MITKKDISEYFDLEAEAAKKSWEELMKLPIDKRIRKRKAIKNVFLDQNYSGSTDEGFTLLRVKVGVNLSDFKEGDVVILHQENDIYGIECTINAFDGEEGIILEVFPPNMPSRLELYYDKPLALDKDSVDLRPNVYKNFIYTLPGEQNEFWKSLLLNTGENPTFADEQKNAEELEDTVKNFELNLLPRQREAIIKSMSAKDYYLIQGPPGTGKSFVLSIVILEELAYFNHKVVVIGPNHMAINNAIEQALKILPGYSNIMYKVGKKYYAPQLVINKFDRECKINNTPYLNVPNCNSAEHPWLIGLTPHCLYTSRARDLECDTLIIDEAGQMTIPLALMGMVKAKKVILAGDHKQLPPILVSDEVRAEMKQSAFQVLIGEGNYTMLDVSFRMCEPICDFVSELFYDGKVKPMKRGCGDMIVCENPLYDFHTPIVMHHVDDDGEQYSDKEALFIAETISGLLKMGLPPQEVAVLTPFRAQAANVRRHLRKNKEIPEEALEHIKADTIDKMQGQEREVIIYSLVSGDLDYMTEMADFLYNPNKMNVAFSRAKSKLIIVGNVEQLRKIPSDEYPHIHAMLESKYLKHI